MIWRSKKDIESVLNTIVSKKSNEEEANFIELLTAAVCLFVFMQVNWTGPPIELSDIQSEVMSTEYHYMIW
jgi:hypothetical protein